MLNADRVLSREQLEKSLPWGQEVESNMVEVYIHNLRKKIGKSYDSYCARCGLSYA